MEELVRIQREIREARLASDHLPLRNLANALEDLVLFMQVHFEDAA